MRTLEREDLLKVSEFIAAEYNKKNGESIEVKAVVDAFWKAVDQSAMLPRKIMKAKL